MIATLTVARREYRQIARTRAFKLTLVLVPLMIVLMTTITTLIRPPEGEAFMVLDKSGRYAPAIAHRIEIEYQRNVLSAYKTYLAKSVPGASTTTPWVSDAEAEAFLASGGADKLIKEVAAQGPPKGRAKFDPPKRRFLEVDPPPAANPRDFQTDIASQLKDGAATKIGRRPLALALYIPADLGAGDPAQAWTNGRPNPYLINLVQGEITRLERGRTLAEAGVGPDVVRRLQAPPPMTVSGTSQAQQARQAIGSIVPSAAAYVLLLTLMITGQMMLQGVIEERSNKLMESVLACIRPEQLMQGKLIGICGIGLTIIAVWGVFAALAISFGPPSFAEFARQALSSVNSPLLFVAIPFYYIFGYAVLSMLFLAVGVLSESMQDAQAYLTPLIMIIVVPYVFLPMTASFDAHALAPRIMSWIPLYTPFAMLTRMSGDVPVWEFIATSVLLIAFAAFEWVMIGRLFRQ
ncbi:MAG TPA: ABC transporter permease, partial [Caulobacteraceae bacterium]|nr:ABC transporter permease [Caulobacteraceae bacterium]